MTMMISLNNNMNFLFLKTTKVLLIKPEEVVFQGLPQHHLKDQEAEVVVNCK